MYQFAWVNRSPSHIGNQTEAQWAIEYWPIIGVGRICRAKYNDALLLKIASATISGTVEGREIRSKGLVGVVVNR
jgi:hypothetical protein